MGGGGLRGARSGSGDEPTRGPFSHPSAGRVDGYSRTDLQFAFHPTAEGVVSLDLIIRFATDDVRRYASPLTRTERERERASVWASAKGELKRRMRAQSFALGAPLCVGYL
jgi:hypothetical protein